MWFARVLRDPTGHLPPHAPLPRALAEVIPRLAALAAPEAEAPPGPKLNFSEIQSRVLHLSFPFPRLWQRSPPT